MNQARNRELDQIVEAEELSLLDNVIQSNYECLDECCRVRLIPCSYKRTNKRRPFFKLPKNHKHTKQCRFSEYLERLEQARKRRLEESELKNFPYPAILLEKSEKDSKRPIPNMRLPNLESMETKQFSDKFNWDRSGNSNRKVSSISQIVDFYLSCPFNRDLNLDILGVKTSYRYWFKRIKGRNDNQYIARRIFFGRLSMKYDCILNLDEEIVITLYECEAWEKPKGQRRNSFVNPKIQKNPYRVHISKVGLTSHKVTRVLNEVNYVIQGQKEAYQSLRESEERAYVFFLADPPMKDLYRFDVLGGYLVSRYVRIGWHESNEDF